ncbi:hypothetical protein B296_00027802 [Ensete ventricosum]|uniref:Uncharacterized protein n=1 Tax=Ensete ventricosum TaxID=4639 RepID=A0A426YPA4_ENSVE|nr:hypothetical protein B296_00027802 [Ensete ventricosum]
MGKYLRKCREGGAKFAVMEVTQGVGARTRPQRTPVSALVSGCNRRKAAAAAAAVAPTGVPTTYLRLRRRGLVVTTPGACTWTNAAATSNASSEVAFEVLDAPD